MNIICQSLYYQYILDKFHLFKSPKTFRVISWNSHINNIYAKANRTISFLRRNIHSCPKEVKRNAYTTLVRPSVEYASAVWDPYTKNQINQLEQVQRRAARFVNNNFYNREPGAVTAMISELSWETLEQRRAKTRAVLM